jgi:Sugar (and other) transporter
MTYMSFRPLICAFISPPTVAVCLLPESPRWLVVSGRLDDALAVIHRVHTSQLLPVGAQYSTAEVENELMELWSSVERDKDAAARRAEEARLRQRGAVGGQDGRGLVRTAHGIPSGGTSGDGDNLIRNKKHTPDIGRSGNGGIGGSNNKTINNISDEIIEHELARLNAGNEDSAAFANEPAWPPPRPPSSQQVRPSSAQGGGTANDLLHSDGAGGAGTHSRNMSRASSSGLADCLTAVDTDTVLGIPPRLPRIRTQSRDRLYAMEQEALAAEAAIAAEEAATGAGAGVAIGNGARFIGEETVALSSTPILTNTTNSTNKLEVHNSSSSPSNYHTQDHNQGQLTTGGGGGGADKNGFWATALDMMKDIVAVSRGPESSAFTMILILAFFNQAFASTAIINYAPSVLQDAGVESSSAASLFTSLVGASKLAGVIIAFFLVDTVGRRPLLLWGSLGSSISLFLLIPGDWLDSHGLLVTGMCLFIFSFSISWAGVFWVLLSESFSMGAKSPAASAATAVLFLTGAVADMMFLSLHSWLGPFVFGLYGIIAIAAAVYVYVAVPETNGRTLQEVQAVLASRRRRW